MANWNTGEANGNWKGGRTVASNGYVLILVGKDHPLADVRGYAYEHRVVASQSLGRWLKDGEVVHHKDENKQNNSPENLEVMPDIAHHMAEHRSGKTALRNPGEKNFSVSCACGCGKSFDRFDKDGRPRNFIPGHNPHPSPTIDAILKALNDGDKTSSQLALETGLTSMAIKVAISKMFKRGLVSKPSRGVYKLKVSNG